MRRLTLITASYDNHLNLLVEDDGKGFDTGSQRKGLGLQSIQSRVDCLSGKVDLTFSDQVTSIAIKIPF